MTAAGVATVRVILEEGILNRTEEIGDYLHGELEELQRKFPALITQVRGIGLMIGVELAVPGGDIVKKALERGLLLNCAQEKVLRFVPPLIVSKAEVDEMLCTLTGILAEM